MRKLGLFSEKKKPSFRTIMFLPIEKIGQQMIIFWKVFGFTPNGTLYILGPKMEEKCNIGFS